MFGFGKQKEKKEVDLIAITAHQLRRPLSSIKLSLEMLTKGDFGPLQKEQKELIEKILGQTSTLVCLVNDLLDMAQTDDHVQIGVPEPVDLVHLVDTVLALSYEEITRKRIHIEFDRSHNLPTVKVRKEALIIALQNVLDNAVKYTKEGGWIKISATINAQNIEIKVQDSGIGIPRPEHKKIFGRFFRATNAKTIAGSGLGLFIAKKVMAANGGNVWFDSQEGAGSTFYITLSLN